MAFSKPHGTLSGSRLVLYGVKGSLSRTMVVPVAIKKISNYQSPGDKEIGPKPKSPIHLLSELSKARLSALVVFTTSTGYLAAGGPIDFAAFASACVGTSLAAASASTFNQILEKDNDKRMNRTMSRPLPSENISVARATAWGVSTGITSGAILAFGTNPLTTALGMGNIFLYAVPYTLSKTRTEANTWIGAMVGAIPPVMGWTAATGNFNAIEPILLGAFLFCWQFPHFMALSWMYKKDYARGGFKMIPCADPSGTRTATLIRRYAVYLTTLPFISTLLGVTGPMFALEGALLNAYCLKLAQQFHKDNTHENAKKVFRASLWYLPSLLSLFVFHSQNWYEHDEQDEMIPVFSLLKQMRIAGRNICVHEMIVKDKEIQQPALCPIVVTEGVINKANETSETAAASPNTHNQNL